MKKIKFDKKLLEFFIRSWEASNEPNKKEVIQQFKDCLKKLK